ncbi:MAG: hypothetical protein H0U44_11460 [Flavisolibacter sp.]|jgi:hypothetical protein|nr:hypothetical protein [Flavisolibacter sp.]
MSLNNLNLTNYQLSSFYGKVLVEEDAAKAEPDLPRKNIQASTPRYLGKNERQILILVNENQHPFLGDEELNFLTNILTACKLSLADVAILNMHQLSPTEVKATFSELKSKKVIAFGIEPNALGLPFHFPEFQVQPFDQTSFLHAPVLKILEADKELKSKFWNSLKIMFDL